MRWRFFLSFAGLGRVLAQLFKAPFTLLSFFSQTKKGEALIGCIQKPLTNCIKSDSLAQSGLNLKGIGLRWSWNTSSSLMGLWSEVLHGRIWTLASNSAEGKSFEVRIYPIWQHVARANSFISPSVLTRDWLDVQQVPVLHKVLCPFPCRISNNDASSLVSW